MIFVLDTEQGEVFQGDLDQHRIGATESAVTVGTADALDEKTTVTLITSDEPDRPDPSLRRAWHGRLDCPSREIGIMDATGAIHLYCPAADPAAVSIWTNDDSEPNEIFVRVG